MVALNNLLNHQKTSPFLHKIYIDMEDCNLLAADGVVICCCCPCLLLQLIIFILLRLPYKLARKSKHLLLRRLAKKKKKKIKGQITPSEVVLHGGGRIKLERELTRILIEGVSSSRRRKTFDDVEKALGELSHQGQFGFGSFWGPEESSSFPPDIGNAVFETVLNYHFIETIMNQSVVVVPVSSTQERISNSMRLFHYQ